MELMTPFSCGFLIGFTVWLQIISHYLGKTEPNQSFKTEPIHLTDKCEKHNCTTAQQTCNGPRTEIPNKQVFFFRHDAFHDPHCHYNKQWFGSQRLVKTDLKLDCFPPGHWHKVMIKNIISPTSAQLHFLTPCMEQHLFTTIFFYLIFKHIFNKQLTGTSSNSLIIMSMSKDDIYKKNTKTQ